MIYIIGIGVEGKSSLSQRALGLIEGAGALIGGRRHLACFPEFQGKKIVIGSDLNKIIKVLTPHSSLLTPDYAVVLATGDPNFFGIADFIIKKIGRELVEIIPNVSAMQEAFARIKENWNDARFLSVHGRNAVRSSEFGVRSNDLIAGLASEIINYNKVGIFTDPDNTPARIANALLNKDIDNYKAYVCEDLGTEQERVTAGSLKQIIKKRFSPLNVMILIRSQEAGVRRQREGLRTPNSELRTLFGIPDSSFSHSNGMITKEEIRVIAISKLKLQNNSIEWA